MFSIDVPKDVRNVQAKLIGPLTLRQTIWTLVGAGCAYAGVALQKVIAPGSNPIGPLIMVFCAPAAIIGFVPIMGMPAEKVFMNYVRFNLINKKRLVNERKNSLKEVIVKANEDYDKSIDDEYKRRLKIDKEFRNTQKMIKSNEEKNLKNEEAAYLASHKAHL